jgi:hypothetical protein
MIHYTRQELKDRSKVTEADIAIAVALWLRFSPSLYRYLMETRLKGTAKSRIVWDSQKKQYMYSATGQYISSLAIRDWAIEPFLRNIKIAMRAISENLQKRTITQVEWQEQTMYLVKYSQIAAALVANGGALNNTPADHSHIVEFVLAMLLFLQIFANGIEDGTQLMNGLLLSRTDLYAEAIRDAYEEMRRYAMGAYGIAALERRILQDGANHCHTVGDLEGCPELADKGWKPIGTLPRLMNTPCRSHCKCYWDFGVLINGKIVSI